MNYKNVVIALTTRDNDYQSEQSAAATAAAFRLGVKVNVVYADNDAVNQCQQLLKIIQDKDHRGGTVLHGGGEFLTVHLKITVTGKAQRQPVGFRKAGRDSRRHTVSHGTRLWRQKPHFGCLEWLHY